MKTNKLLIAAVLAIAVGAPIAAVVGETTVPTTSPALRVPFLHGFPTTQTSGQSELASLARADEWINSPPLTPEALRGKVVLIDFWTYTCINWLRTAPYVRAWADKYRDKGLVVIGVHAPEFAFEKELEQCPTRREGPEGRSSGRGRQRPRHLARVQKPILAGAVLRRCAGPCPPSSLRRGRIRAIRNGHPAIAGRGRRDRHRPRAGGGQWSGPRGGGRLGEPEVRGKLSRVWAHRELCIARRRDPGQAAHV